MEVLKRKVNESWRSILPIHPAAGLFPLMSPDELRALGEDIRKHGLRLPCSLVEDEYGDVALFDGRNRLDALELIGKEITLDNSIIFERFPADSIDVTERVVSLNIHRRHLTAEQKRDLVAKLIKADPSKSDRQIAETVKASPTTVGTVRAKMEAKGDVSNLDTRRDTKGRQQPAHRTTSAPSEAKTHKIKFTPERIAQIKNLVERGISREEIAEIIGVTTSSLQTTCSRLGISLRRKARTTPTPPPPEDTRDDVGPASTSEVARPQSRVSELQAEKRGLEIENVGLRSEVQDAKAERKPELAPDGETAFYCSFCGKSQHDVDTLITDGGRLKPVCICNECVDLCVNIIKDRSSAAHEEAAAPPVSGDYPDIPESLRRAAP